MGRSHRQRDGGPSLFSSPVKMLNTCVYHKRTRTPNIKDSKKTWKSTGNSRGYFLSSSLSVTFQDMEVYLNLLTHAQLAKHDLTASNSFLEPTMSYYRNSFLASSNGGDSPLAQPAGRSNIADYRRLYNACARGDWEKAKKFSESIENAWTSTIDDDGYGSGSTALSIAAMAGQTNFIKELVKNMEPADLEKQDHSLFTALHNVATNGNKEVAEILVSKNRKLTLIRNCYQETPLLRAALFGHEDLFRYLLKETQKTDADHPTDPSPFTGKDGATLLVTLIDANLYDVALELVKNKKYEGIATIKDHAGRYAIHALATKSWPTATMTQENRQPIRRGCKNPMLGTWDRVFPDALKNLVPGMKDKETNKIMYKHYLALVHSICEEVEKLNDSKEMLEGTILKASEHGNVDFIRSVIKIDHNQLILSCDDTCQSALHNAVKHRQKQVFYYLKESGFKDELALKKDSMEETILHLAAKMSPPCKLEEISGAALQMQHEIQWYKEVEKIVQPFYRDRQNKDKMSPREMFTEQHKALVVKGEEWMKHMASHSMLVGTLIATVVFAAAFTVPGGNNQGPPGIPGMPVFLSKRAYMVFAVSNALAFFSSLTSVLTFLSILTARYAEDDFLRSLPQRLIIGLAMLFFAIATMVMAFISTYFLMLGHGHKRAWISILMAVLTCVPVTLFAFLQFRLFVEMFKSTYKSTL